jgi:hypothetical protein
MTWDISPEHDQEYFEFVIRDFVPGIQRLGFELSDAWLTVFGDQPQIMVGAVLPTVSKVRQVMRTVEWKNLNQQLMDFVRNYNEKIVEARNGFQF